MSRIGMESRVIPKISSLRLWVLEQLGSIRHERRVMAAATSLFNICTPLHTLDSSDLRLLRMAALVHDVGRSLDDEDHPAVGARMIEREASLRLKKRHRRALAYLTLRHRGEVPEVGHEPVLRESDDARRLRLLLGFLRAADCFDSRSLPSPRLSFSRRGRRIQIHCMLREESAKARRVFSRRKKFRLLEEMLGCRVEVVIGVQRRLRAVA